MKENDVHDNEQDEDTLIPEYIELTADEEEAIEELQTTALSELQYIDGIHPSTMKNILSTIEKLVAHIETQNMTILDLAVAANAATAAALKVK